MNTFYDTPKHIKCDDPDCTGDVKFDKHRGYVCDKCEKSVGYHYVESQRDILLYNEKTGWIYPMMKRGKTNA